MSLIQVSNLTFCYEGSCDNIFENVSFQIDTDWRLDLTGRNGRGKTTLLRLLQGMYPHRGTIRASVGFDYFPYTVPDPEECPLELLPAICPEVPQWCFLRELAPLEVPEEALYRPFSTLSGGERSRILLAMLFSRDNRFLLIDEPTNHLDRAGRELVSRYLRSKRGFLLVSHDRAFLDGCVDHILSINPSGIELQRGNFSSWYENKQRRDAYELAQNAQLKKEIGRLKEAAGSPAPGPTGWRAPRSAQTPPRPRARPTPWADGPSSVSSPGACSSAARIWSGGSRTPLRKNPPC